MAAESPKLNDDDDEVNDYLINIERTETGFRLNASLARLVRCLLARL